MDQAAWRIALKSDDVSSVRQRLDADPEATGGYLAVERDWGEELWLPLHVAVEVGGAGAAEVVALLLERGAKADARTRFRTPMHARATALHLASQRIDPALVAMLLHAGADADAMDARGDTPLHRLLTAAAGRLLEGADEDVTKAVRTCFSLLLESGADPTLRNTEGRPPWHAFLATLKTPTALLNASQTVNVSGVENSGDSATDLRLAADLLGTCGDLHRTGKTTDIWTQTCPREPGGFSLLHRCVMLRETPGGAVALARTLVGEGSDPHAAPPGGRSALELAQDAGADGLVAAMTAATST